ncbi:MAG: hypothetical protein ABFC62_00335 [Clostridiaceae bacterium]|nr:hypothetical protein [Eubacteriales bacterium]
MADDMALLRGVERLGFPGLFAARKELAERKLRERLQERAKIALNIAEQLLKRDARNKNSPYLKGKNAAELAALLWMLETGSREEAGGDEYEEVLDGVSAVLLSLYRERRALPYAVDMIFLRAKRGHDYHDLFWAVSRFGDPYALKLLAKRLDAPEAETAALARRLLGMDAVEANAVRSKEYEAWLEENDPFLYFTGESLQYSARPAVCRVDLERKYAGRESRAYERQPFEPQNDEERKRLAEFKALPEPTRTALADYAHALRAKDPEAWARFKKQPVAHQAEAANRRGGNAPWSI